MTGLCLDHAGIAVRDLAAARAVYAALGFTLTPLSIHSGSRTPGGPVEPWGSGNHCAMFDTGYIELIGIVDSDRPSSVPPLLTRYEGAHILALRCTDADATHRALADRAARVDPPRALQRDAPFGPGGAETRRAAFRNIHCDGGFYSVSHLIIIEHRTPDVLWQPHLTVHPNGVTALTEAVLAVEDPATTAERLAVLAGVVPEIAAPGRFTVPLERGRLTVLGPEAAEVTYGVMPPAEPAIVAITLGVSDLAPVRALAERDGIEAWRHGAGLLIPASAACGVALRLEPTNG